MKKFDIPTFYRSPVIGKIKELSKIRDPRKKDYTPSILDLGEVQFLFARHFGFCYGVENAIEISYRAIDENPGKRIFLLSQMIHNQEVNRDLESRGIQFLMDTHGKSLISLDVLKPEDVVIIPAFGTSIETENILKEKGIQIEKYNTTCPFVEKVWNRSAKLGNDGYTIIIHGKEQHEETRATFSHSSAKAPSLVIRDMDEAELLCEYISGRRDSDSFEQDFPNRASGDFDPNVDLRRVGVVNQTTMLATETQAIAERIKSEIVGKFGEENYKEHFADTRDTLCYATNDNQQATYGLLNEKADLAFVIGGYNSSNTSHLVELCESELPTYFINKESEILNQNELFHFDIHRNERVLSRDFLPVKRPLKIVLTSGASCPDALVEEVLHRLVDFFPGHRDIESALADLEA